MNDQSRAEQFRSRWLRWLGQKTRQDKPYWVTLLDCNWSGWAYGVLREHGATETLSIHSDREEIKSYYRRAILLATDHDMIRLDGLYAQAKVERSQ